MGTKTRRELKGRCLILGGGDIADVEAARRLILPDDFVICADSGLDRCEILGVHPDLAVGDFDSAKADPPPGVPVVRLPENKNYTDSMFALREAEARGFREVLLLGMLGGRLDHTLGNLQNLIWCEKHNIAAECSDGRTWITVFENREITLEPRPNSYFSAFALGGICRRVNIRGGKYPLEDYDLAFYDSRAVSNEFMGIPVRISAEEGILAAVILPKD